MNLLDKYCLRLWDINENYAIDILQQVSFVHKYMDQCIPVRHLT